MWMVLASALLVCPQVPSDARAVGDCLARVKEVHGAAGPWAVAGYRMGQRAVRELGLPRHSFRLFVVHRTPAEVQYLCVADGLQAATGASPGKLNLTLEPASVEAMRTVISDRETGQTLTFTVRPEFARSIRDLPRDRLEAEWERVAALPDDAIFTITRTESRDRN